VSASDSTPNPFRPPAPGTLPAAGELAPPQIDGDRIRLQFQLSPEDVVAMAMHWYKSSGFLQKQRNFAWFLGGLVSLLGAAFVWLDWHRDFSGPLLGYFWIALGLAVAVGLSPWHTNAPPPMLRVAQAYEFTPRSVETASVLVEQRMMWTLVEDIRRDDSGIYLFIGPAQALTLPRRIFASDAEFKHAFALLTEFRRANKSAGAIV
jgi:YcxB-like protein